MQIKYYAGIGSRETPEDILIFFRMLGVYLAKEGYTLRSGAAHGADKAFEVGCDKVQGEKEIYLPWKGFNGSNSYLYGYNHAAQEIAAKFHPAWHSLKPTVRQLHARNVLQVLGRNLDSPSQFVICWTKNGTGSGGTGQALRIAKGYDIPIFDAGKHGDISKVKSECRAFLGQFVEAV